MQNGPPQTRKVRVLLAEAGEALQTSRRSLFRTEPAYPASLAGSLKSLRRAFLAFITWHHLELPEDAPLRAFTHRAVPLASMLRTYEGLALPLEPLADELLEACDCSAVANREEVERGYYTARNAFYVIFDELPEAVRPAPPVPRSEAFARRTDPLNRSARSCLGTIPYLRSPTSGKAWCSSRPRYCSPARSCSC